MTRTPLGLGERRAQSNDTGDPWPVSPDVLVSKRGNVAYDPSAKCPRFEQFLKEVQPDKEVAFFLLRLMGIVMAMSAIRCSGSSMAMVRTARASSSNLWLWAARATTRARLPTDMLMQHQRNPQGPNPDIVSLKGLRLGVRRTRPKRGDGWPRLVSKT